MDGKLHILGHPDLPLRIGEHPEDSQLFNCWNFCKLAEVLEIDYTYYGLPGSELPPGSHGSLEILGKTLPRVPWSCNSSRHRRYTAQLNAALAPRIRTGSAPQWIISLYGIAQSGIYPADLPVVEPMVGYTGCWAQYRVFPSFAHRNCIYSRGEIDPERRFCDTVIPHFLDPEEYIFSAKPGDYLLYLGRDAADKGVSIARECAEASGMELRCFHSGLSGRRKGEILAGARAVLMPTLYPEPFGYVAAEAMISGTPVIATAWGAFPELLEHGKTGWCCNSKEEICEAIARAGSLDRKRIRRHGLKHFTLRAVAPAYRNFLDRVWQLHQKTN